MKKWLQRAESRLDAWGGKLETVEFTLPTDLVTGVGFLLFSIILLLLLPTQVKVNASEVVDGKSFPTLLLYVMMACSVGLILKELIAIFRKKPIATKTVNLLVEVKALLIFAILLATYLLCRTTRLFVVGGVFCAVSFLVFFRCKKPLYYAITVTAAVLIWCVFRFVLGVRF